MHRLRFGTILSRFMLIQLIFLLSCFESGKGSEELEKIKPNGDSKFGSFSKLNGKRGCTNDYQVEYLRLILRWIPGYCSTSKLNCKSSIANFVVGGLRPTFKDAQDPVRCCTKERFNKDILLLLKSKLKDNWSSLDARPDEDIWPYEWEHHGRCGAKIRGIHTITNYFNFALNQLKKLNLEKILMRSDFTDRLSFDGFSIMETITQHYKVRPAMKCALINSSSKQKALTEIHFCYDLKLSVRDCPDVDNTCLGEIMLPSR